MSEFRDTEGLLDPWNSFDMFDFDCFARFSLWVVLELFEDIIF